MLDSESFLSGYLPADRLPSLYLGVIWILGGRGEDFLRSQSKTDIHTFIRAIITVHSEHY